MYRTGNLGINAKRRKEKTPYFRKQKGLTLSYQSYCCCILDHGKVWKNPYSEKKTIIDKIKSIRAQIEQNHPVLSKKLEALLFDDIIARKEERNKFVHHACTHACNEEQLQELANSGKLLVDKLCNAADRVKNASVKLN